jgi:hypothetical protein
MLLLLISLSQSQSTLTDVFGSDPEEPFLGNYMSSNNNHEPYFLWMFHPKFCNLKELPSEMPLEAFMFLSDRQIKLLTKDSVEKGNELNGYNLYFENLEKDISDQLLEVEFEFVLMVVLYRSFKRISTSSPEHWKRNFWIISPLNAGCNLYEIFDKGNLKQLIEKYLEKNFNSHFSLLVDLAITKKFEDKDLSKQFSHIEMLPFRIIDAFIKLEETLKVNGNHISSVRDRLKIFEENRTIFPKPHEKIQLIEGIVQDQEKDQEKLERLLRHLTTTWEIRRHKDTNPVLLEAVEEISNHVKSSEFWNVVKNKSKYIENEFDETFSQKIVNAIKIQRNSDYYDSYVQTVEEKEYTHKKSLRDWASGLVADLVNSKQNATIDCSASKEESILTVIIEALDPEQYLKYDVIPCSNNDIHSRIFFVYSLQARETINLLLKLFQKYHDEEAGSGFKTNLFSLISEVLFEYSDFYSLMSIHSTKAVEDKVTDFLEFLTREFSLNIHKEVDFGSLKIASLAFRLLPSNRDLKKQKQKTKLSDREYAWMGIISFMNFPYNQYLNDWIVDLVNNRRNNEFEIAVLFEGVLNHTNCNCERIFREGNRVWLTDEESIKKCKQNTLRIQYMLENSLLKI